MSFFKASRSCHEMKLLGVSTSGTYFIDPDGFQGSPPVQVYCDMKTGKCPKSMANIIFHLYLLQVPQLSNMIWWDNEKYLNVVNEDVLSNVFDTMYL